MKATELRGRTRDQLAEQLLQLKKEQFNLRFQRASGQLENTARVREVRRDIARLVRARDVISVGKISGAVGTFANIDPAVEEFVCRKLRLSPAPASTQVIQRDRHAEVFATLAIVASSLDKFSTEIRHLQRT